jgi:hypothetical protein
MKKRNFPGSHTLDTNQINNLGFNEISGAAKNTDIGKHLIPLNDGAGGFTTDATAYKILPAMGKSVAIYNNSAAVQSVTLGESTAIVSLGVGVTDASGHVGIPCKPSDWTIIACGESQYIITSSADLLVFLIDDNTYLINQ